MKKRTLLITAIIAAISILTVATIVYAAPALVVNSSSFNITEGSSANLKVHLAEDPATPASVINISVTSNNPACTFSNTTIGIGSNYTTDRNITINVADDTVYTPNAKCIVTLTASGDNYAGISTQVTVNIGENEPAPAFVFTESGGTYVTESGTTDSFTVNLNVMPTSNVVVSLVPDSQCKLNDNQLTFTTASWNTPKSVTVSAVDDLADEANIHNCFISVTTLDAYTANEYDNVSASFQVEVDDNDDTAPGFTFSPSSLAINEGEKDTFNVKLNSLPTKNVLVRAYSNQPWVCSVTPSEFTLTQDSFITGKSFTVSALWTYSSANLACSIYVEGVSEDGVYDGMNKTLSVQTYNTWSATLTPTATATATITPIPSATAIPTNTLVPTATEIVATNTPYVIVVTSTSEPTQEGAVATATTAPSEPTNNGDTNVTPSIGVIAIVAAAAIVLFAAVGVGAYLIVRKFF